MAPSTPMKGPTVPLLLQSPAPVSSTWNAVAVQGAFEGHPAGPFELNEKVFKQIVANFKADPLGRVNVDLDHRSETLEGSALDAAFAPAWITDLRIDNGKLMGLFEWTDSKTVDMVRSGQLMFLSPSIAFNATHPVSGDKIGARLSSVALTNKPFLREIPVVNASEVAADTRIPGSAGTRKGKRMEPDKEVDPREVELASYRARNSRLCSMLALGADAKAEEVETAVGALKKAKDESDSRETARMEAEAELKVAARVDAGIIPNTDKARASAKAVCLRDPGEFLELFPEPKKPLNRTGSTEAALLSGRVLGVGGLQGTVVPTSGDEYRTQLFTLTEKISSELRVKDPGLGEYEINMRASSEAKRTLAAQAVERIAR